MVDQNQNAICRHIHAEACGGLASTGIYFYRFKAKEFVDVKKMVFMK